MNKIFITAGELLQDSFLLASEVFRSGFAPDFILGLWRGGAPVGIAVQEYLHYQGITTDHMAIRTSAYTGIDQFAPKVSIFGLAEVIARLRGDMRLLVVDDVFDSGRSIEAVITELRARAGTECPTHIRIACPWFKPRRNVTALRPDYFIHETDQWLVFPHELMGLPPEELRAGKSDLAAIFERLQLQSRP
ncbi:MAG: hypoxanthine phosphoribosyltransferase [Gammaproteobacteria bacterium]|nr:hypoxanthine phosphoribosyltransferase [Gammaproteobacteria bacterium]